MAVDSNELPNYLIPPMDSHGTQEAIVDVTFGMVDFLSGCNTVAIAELNAWYHMLNCGFRLTFAGETDWPCIYDERPGVGRSYVRLLERPVDERGYQTWIEGLAKGRNYAGDGRSHILDFRVNGLRNGEDDVCLSTSGNVHVEALVAARLDPQPGDEARALKKTLKGWHLERSRIADSREVLDHGGCGNVRRRVANHD